MALTGQGATQAPQPVHSSGSIAGKGLPPRRGVKRMARLSQKSPQARHSTPLCGRQLGAIRAWRDQAACSSERSRARGWQTVTQSAQKVHSPRLKSTSGKPPTMTMMRVGQTGTQSPQRLQALMNSSSASAHGGRCGAGTDLKLPRRNCRLLTMLDREVVQGAILPLQRG